MALMERELRGPGPLELRYLRFVPQVLIAGAFLFEIPAGGRAPTFAEISGGVRTATVTARTAVTDFVVEDSVVSGLLAEDPMAGELLMGLSATRAPSPQSLAIAQ